MYDQNTALVFDQWTHCKFHAAVVSKRYASLLTKLQNKWGERIRPFSSHFDTCFQGPGEKPYDAVYPWIRLEYKYTQEIGERWRISVVKIDHTESSEWLGYWTCLGRLGKEFQEMLRARRQSVSEVELLYTIDT